MEQNPAAEGVESRKPLRWQTNLMGCIPTKVLVGFQENAWMKGETNLAPDGYWKLMAEGLVLMKESSDSGCRMPSRSEIR